MNDTNIFNYVIPGLRILEQYDLLYYHDSIAQTANYAVLLTEMGQPERGLSALKKLSLMIRDLNSDQTIDYATVQEAMGGVCLAAGDIRQAFYSFTYTTSSPISHSR